ncbi:MAG: N-acetylglucosamine-6-phosphate deacetylase, partial [Armatimonadota bacterium]|nr:N-acetylglucosamine-6-phosphate deacetylase [Armatimonadota bacterium]
MLTSSSLALRGGTAITPTGSIENSVLLLEGGRIVEIGSADSITIPSGLEIMDTTGCVVLPGFIDTHFHGCHGHDVMSGGSEGITNIAHALPQYGVTGFLPTTIAAPHADILSAIEACRGAIEAQTGGAARILGIHLEGPYINPVMKGAQPLEGIRPPDMEQCRAYLEAGQGLVRIMTLAPEVPGGFDLVRMLCDNGVLPSMGHTNADYDTAVEAIRLGATHGTHLFNQMTPLHHRKPGVVTALLTEPDATVELITDGVHVAPAMIKMAFKLKGISGMTLITDAISAMGVDEGAYNLGGHRITVRDGRCTLDDGTLAGSVHRMDRAFLNAMRFTGCTLAEASAMASAGPARLIGVAARKGTLERGKD